MIQKDFKVEVPSFADYKVSIHECGAVPNRFDIDTARNNAKVINKAIEETSNKGGGTVIIENGVWLTGPIELKSNVRLFLEHQAVLKFSKDKQDYPLILTDYEGTQRIRAVSPITADNVQNIAICGSGIIDGSGDQWRPVKEWKLTPRVWKALLDQSDYISTSSEGGFWFPTKTSFDGYQYHKIHAEEATEEGLEKGKDFYDYYRPVMISLKHCSKILLDGVTFMNSPAWNIHPYFCSDLTLSNANIKNDFSAQNGDGIDVESCKRVHIYNTTFETGDDAICLKAGKDEEARKIKGTCEDIYIHDCLVYQAHGGFVVGSEMSRGVRNVKVERCNFVGTDVGIRMKSCLGRGGVVEDIDISDINMMNIKNEAVIMTMSYSSNKSKKNYTLENCNPEDIPYFRRINMSNIQVLGTKVAIKIQPIQGLPETIKDITISNSVFQVNSDSDNEMEKLDYKEKTQLC